VNILETIVERKRAEVAQRKEEQPLAVLEQRVSGMAPVRSLFGVLSDAGGETRVVAEIKRASPSRGPIKPELDPAEQARVYARSGAGAISVLTDGEGFGGSLEDLATVRQAVDLPVLRKDFIIDPYQLLEARAGGADAVLLIVAALDEDQLGRLHTIASDAGLEALVEVHNETELERARSLLDCSLIGINNRDLATFEVDLSISERLAPLVAKPIRVIAESGIVSAQDVHRLRASGIANFLVGEALVASDDSGGLLRQLLGTPV
jgi:indole-3-glycerol phosphate synthase